MRPNVDRRARSWQADVSGMREILRTLDDYALGMVIDSAIDLLDERAGDTDLEREPPEPDGDEWDIAYSEWTP